MKRIAKRSRWSLVEPAIACVAALVLELLTDGAVRWVFAGIAAVTAAMLLSRVTADFASGVALRRESALKPGDAVSTGTTSGQVVKIGWLKATLLEGGTSGSIRIRNSELAEKGVGRFTDGALRRQISGVVVVRRASDPEVIRRLLLDIARDQVGVLSEPPPEVLFEKIDANTLRFRFVAWTLVCQDSGARLESDLATAVGDRFAALGIDAVVRFASDESRLDLE